MDVTLGKALKIVEGNDTLFEHLAKGGSVGVVIISLGLVCLIIGGFKAYEITNFKTPSRKNVQKRAFFTNLANVHPKVMNKKVEI